MYFLDMFVAITSFQNSKDSVITKVNIFETYFFNWMVWVCQKCVSNMNSSFVIKAFILCQHQLGNILGSLTC